MARFGLAFKAFFRTLRDPAFAASVQVALAGPKETPAPVAEAPPAKKPVEKPAAPRRSEAVTLLAALQREARLVDFVQESLGEYSDAQVGAAVRDVHRDCRAALERWFGLQPVVGGQEGEAVDVPAGFDAARFRLSGNVAGQPPYRGTLCHHGWQAARCELPAWTGSATAALVVAPAEVELK